MKNKKKERKYGKFSCLCWAMQRMWRLDKRFVFFIFASVPFSVALPLAESYFAKMLIDRIGSGAPFSELAAVVATLLLGILALQTAKQWVNMQCVSRQYYPTLVYQSEMAAFENAETDFENTEKKSFKDLRGYAFRDASGGNCAPEFLWRDLTAALIHLTGIFTYASLLVTLHPVIFVAVAVTSVLSYYTMRWQPVYREKNKHKWEDESRKKTYLQKLSGDFAKAKDVKLYGLEPLLNTMMRDYQAYILMWNQRVHLRGLWASVLAGLMSLVQNGVAYIVLIGILLAGGMTVGDFVFYFGIVGSIAGFLQGIVGDVAKLNTRAEKIAYYRAFFDYPSKGNHSKGCTLPAAPVKIELKDVWYRYDGAEEYTIKGVDLVIEGGESIALVGMNGAGKTTLIKLICGMYTPTKGEILVDGKRIEEYNIEEYYSMISAVFQQIAPVAFTLFEFVASADLARATARADAIAAMQAAGIYEKIESLPNGIDTHLMKGIYDDGVDFSGGEMQKLVLARAIYKNGSVLILDEPTSALDPIAENKLYLQYRALTKGKTSIYISHRFASTRFCDRILLLQNGCITESGTHEELMAKKGQYAHMFGVQAKYYKEGEIHA